MPAISTAPHDAASLRKIAKRLTSLALRLEAAAEILDGRAETVEITHQAELLNGLKRVENWGDAVFRCVHKHLEESGAFQAVPAKKKR